MDKKYEIRPVRVEDFPTLNKWWDSYDHIEVPDSGLLPNNGLGGYVVEKEGKIRACAFLYFTNSDVAYVDYLVGDPNYKGRDRYSMILDLIDLCTAVGLKEGCRLMWAMTTYDGVVKRCRDLGYEVLEDKYSVIYTHEKVASKLQDGNS